MLKNITKTVTLAIISLICVFNMSSCYTDIYPDASLYSVGGSSVTQNIDTINITWKSGSINVKYHDKNTVEFSETSKLSLNDRNSLHWYLNNNELNINFAESGLFNFFNIQKDLTLLLPEGFSAKKINIDSSSTDIVSEEINADVIYVDSSSGDVKLSVGRSDKVEIDTASGNILLNASDVYAVDIDSSSGEVNLTVDKSDKIKIDTASGNVQLNVADVSDVDIDSSSGDIVANVGSISGFSVESSSGNILITAAKINNIDIKSSSGFIKLDTDILPQQCNIDSSSGSIDIALPENADFTLNLDLSSSNFNSNFAYVMDGNKYVCGNGNALFNIESSSGDVVVNKK